MYKYQSNERCSSVILLSFIGLYFFSCNILLPLLSDDYAYAFIWNGTAGGNLAGMQPDAALQRVQNWTDLVVSQWSHYFSWGGRSLAHVLVQFFIWQGKLLFDFANTAVFLLLLLLIYWLGGGKRGQLPEKRYILWGFLCLWLCNLSFADTCLWLTASCNYLWMAVLQLLFLLPYSHAYFACPAEHPDRCGKWGSILLFLAGLTAGWSNETGGFLMLLAAAALWQAAGRPRCLAAGLAGAALGYLMLMLAPGNFVRSALLQTQGSGSVFAERIKTMILLLAFMLPMLLPIMPFLHKNVQKMCVDKKALQYMFFFLGLGILNLLILLAVPATPLRAGFISLIFGAIASTMGLTLQRQGHIRFWQQRFCWLLYGLAAIYCLVSMSAALLLEVRQYPQQMAREEILAASRGQQVIVLPYEQSSLLARLSLGHTGVGDLTPDCDDWLNRCVARYYDLESIQLEK